ncbi:peptidoglycan recognition protein [Streptomyces griseorubiginosus]|uniref:peptidoglycan recognition protein family protein n=1 Tax=Streptomyces griseorubiginosus TaxID=67304 RepID=UPI002E82473B|nr:peptidoglycan recognition protein [Streptomyces griseorubiginosus]WUB44764.1 peptidoglycan recognition protein [Streptomyces griseorubiginosus]WUB53281.1 peptidoglycan recognition protein [Streptomyces griseorubiginosus]
MKRRAWLTLGAVVLGGGGIASYAVASPSTDAAGDPRAERPVKVYDLALKAPETGERELPRTETKQFSLLGISWTGATKQLDGKAQVRTRSLDTGAWTSWQDLETDADPVEDADERAGARGASEPLWVGPSDGVEVQVVHEDGTTSAGLPSGLKVNLVDPGVTAAEAADAATEPAAYTEDVTPSPTATTPTAPATTPTSPAPTATTPTAPTSTVPEPPIVSRADWGADESLSPDPSEYNADVKAVFVHHTAGSNDYTCAESASIVRAIYAYHTAPAPDGNGWNDLGYNFLVDKCGTIFEGRKGGVDQPVLGAHTYGWNRESTGIAVIGEYTSAGASTAALTSVARIAAWKLGQYGVDPNSTVQLKAGATQKNLAGTSFTAGSLYTFNRISGHRDGYATECPGTTLYGQLPTIRAWASGPVQGLKVTSLTGATLSGSTYYTKGAITAKWSTTTPGSLISKFELLVDGTVVKTTAGTATSASTTLAAGTHKVAVRAVHQSGKTTPATTALTVVADTTAPVFSTTPKITLRAGTVETAAVPVTLGWKATDAQALKQVSLLSPTTATFGPTTTSSNRTAKSGSASTWSMKAYDVAGNTRTSSPAYTPMILQETSATKSGSWTARSSSSYLGGKSYSSGSKNASLTWTFTGKSAAWVVSRASTSGQAYVYVDGTKVATVDLKSATTKYRQAIWTKSWASSAQHKIKIVVVGTSGRPTITTDGLVYIK